MSSASALLYRPGNGEPGTEERGQPEPVVIPSNARNRRLTGRGPFRRDPLPGRSGCRLTIAGGAAATGRHQGQRGDTETAGHRGSGGSLPARLEPRAPRAGVKKGQPRGRLASGPFPFSHGSWRDATLSAHRDRTAHPRFPPHAFPTPRFWMHAGALYPDDCVPRFAPNTWLGSPFPLLLPAQREAIVTGCSRIVGGGTRSH